MWSGGPQSSLTMYHEKAKRESQRFEETLRGSKSESPRPHLPQPFLSPTPETHPGKKICIYLQNKKGRAAKIPANAGVIKKQSAAATPTPPPPFPPPASHRSLPLLVLHLQFPEWSTLLLTTSPLLCAEFFDTHLSFTRLSDV